MNFREIQLQGFRNEAEREFLTALFAHAFEWKALGVTDEECMICYSDSILMVAFDICDWNGNVVLRSLKVDFDGTRVLTGETESQTVDIKFDTDSPNIEEINQVGASPMDLAEAAAKWLYHEISRPIVFREWITWFSHHKEYEILDHNQSPDLSESKINKRRSSGMPTRAAIVHPKNSRRTL